MAAGRPGTDAVDEAWITPPSTVPRSDGIGLRVDLDSKRLSGASDSIRSTLCGQRHGLAIRPAPPPGRSARSGTSPAPAATSASARRTSVGVCLTTWWKRSFSTAPLRPNVRFTHRANGCQGSSCRSPACPCRPPPRSGVHGRPGSSSAPPGSPDASWRRCLFTAGHRVGTAQVERIGRRMFEVTGRCASFPHSKGVQWSSVASIRVGRRPASRSERSTAGPAWPTRHSTPVSAGRC